MTLSSTEVSNELAPFEFSKGRKASWATLRNILPDVETALFFAKAFRMDYRTLSELIARLFSGLSVVEAINEGGHSTVLQDYIVDTVPYSLLTVEDAFDVEAPDPGEFLDKLWESIDLVVANSIATVADKLASVLNSLPSKEGQMVFKSMMSLNRQRPTLGVHKAVITHQAVPETLVILDVSGSMTQATIEKIVGDVVAMSWKANATLAIVSNSTFVWEPGTYSVSDVLAKAEYGGTYYETLIPLLQRDWGTVITIADYDSSYSAHQAIGSACRGRIGQVFDISLVNQPTYLAECVGQLADSVEPMLVAATRYPISA